MAEWQLKYLLNRYFLLWKEMGFTGETSDDWTSSLELPGRTWELALPIGGAKAYIQSHCGSVDVCGPQNTMQGSGTAETQSPSSPTTPLDVTLKLTLSLVIKPLSHAEGMPLWL